MSEISCEEVLDQVEHYLHGELDPELSARLAEHLAECSPCWDRAEFQRKLKDIVRAKCGQGDAPAQVEPGPASPALTVVIIGHVVSPIHPRSVGAAIRADRPRVLTVHLPIGWAEPEGTGDGGVSARAGTMPSPRPVGDRTA